MSVSGVASPRYQSSKPRARGVFLALQADVEAGGRDSLHSTFAGLAQDEFLPPLRVLSIDPRQGVFCGGSVAGSPDNQGDQ